MEKIIHHYHARVADRDKDIRFNEFKKEDSSIRIIFATTSLGMGINVPDISRVVQWNFPINYDVADLWQRLGRGGRGPGRTSTGYWFIPYYAFDSQLGQHKKKKRKKTTTRYLYKPI